jgi:hypothetical protein
VHQLLHLAQVHYCLLLPLLLVWLVQHLLLLLSQQGSKPWGLGLVYFLPD